MLDQYQCRCCCCGWWWRRRRRMMRSLLCHSLNGRTILTHNLYGLMPKQTKKLKAEQLTIIRAKMCRHLVKSPKSLWYIECGCHLFPLVPSIHILVCVIFFSYSHILVTTPAMDITHTIDGYTILFRMERTNVCISTYILHLCSYILYLKLMSMRWGRQKSGNQPTKKKKKNGILALSLNRCTEIRENEWMNNNNRHFKKCTRNATQFRYEM